MALKKEEITKLFGGIHHERNGDAPAWLLEGKYMVILPVPEGYEHWINSLTGKPTKNIYCNSFMREPLLNVLKEIKESGLAHELKTFDGCFAIRKVRGSEDKWSWHSFGLAVDCNAATNKLGERGDMHPGVVAIFRKHGFLWGGFFKRRDNQHFQFVIE